MRNNLSEEIKRMKTMMNVMGEIVTDKKVICDNCGWSWNKNEGGEDMYICHKCGTDNEPHNQLNEVTEKITWGQVAQLLQALKSQETKQGAIESAKGFGKLGASLLPGFDFISNALDVVDNLNDTASVAKALFGIAKNVTQSELKTPKDSKFKQMTGAFWDAIKLSPELSEMLDDKTEAAFINQVILPKISKPGNENEPLPNMDIELGKWLNKKGLKPRADIHFTSNSGSISEQIGWLNELCNLTILKENIVDDTLNEVRYDFLRWKRQNVTIRGVRELGSENNAGAQFGDGLYTAFLSNRDMARKYGDVYFVVNAKPKTPKVVNNTNDAEIFFQNIVNKWCKERGLKYDPRAFHEETDYKTEMLKMGYDGLVIKGREMVNYNPPDNVLYFKNERELEDYYNKNSSFLNEQTFMGNFVWNHVKDITPDEDDVPWGFKDKIRNAEFENVPNFNLESLLKTDPDFREYYESDDVRYAEDEVDPRDIELEIVVVDGELLDGYSRAATLLRNGEKTTNAFVGKSTIK